MHNSIIVMESPDKLPVIMEPVLFTRLNEGLVSNAKPSQLMPLIEYMGAEWDLRPKRLKDFKTIKKIIIHSIKNN